jgi:cytochrome c-type biogenesis protein CcmH/NrfG
MTREPMVFFAGGMIFGFALGFMVANLGERGESRAIPPTERRGADAGASEASPSAPDPDEVRALQSLAEKDAANVKVRVQLGNIFMDHSRFEEAGGWYRQALALEPGNADVRVDLGACLVNTGKAVEGLQEFEQVLKTNPTHKKALFNKGIALMATGRPKDAVAIWEDLLRRFPEDPQLRGLREQINEVRAQMKRTS